ncbi:MAG: type II secretion system F family protein [Planctomycetaceae bacterium]|nr:type II secretion system F family protein [Planctomycetaceae bacterium]
MSHKELAEFCRRMGICLSAGLSLLDTIKREAERTRHPKIWKDVAESLQCGNTLAESLKPHHKALGEVFPTIVEVGEESGHLAETFTELADYYDELLEVRRSFTKSLFLPIVELVAALVIIGLVILLLGVIREITGNEVDILGFGLIGFRGFIVYVCFIACVAAALYITYIMIKRSVQWSRLVHHFIDRIPRIGRLFRLLSLMKLTWAFYLTMRTGMDVRRALQLSFSTAGYAPVSDAMPDVVNTIECGGNLTEAFSSLSTGIFPVFDNDFVTAVETGEQTGELPEVMQRLSRRYLAEGLMQLKTVSVIGGFLLYGMIMAFIVMLIFRIAMFYIGVLTNAGAGI